MAFFRLSCWVSITSESHEVGNKECSGLGKGISGKGNVQGTMYSSKVGGTQISSVIFTQ